MHRRGTRQTLRIRHPRRSELRGEWQEVVTRGSEASRAITGAEFRLPAPVAPTCPQCSWPRIALPPGFQVAGGRQGENTIFFASPELA